MLNDEHQRSLPVDCQVAPRSGLLTALAEAVASAFGRRVDRRALRNGCRALEHANAAVFRRPLASELLDELPIEPESMLIRLVDRFGDRVDRLCDTIHPTDHPVPEGVFLGRAAMALASVSADVDPSYDRALQELGVVFGLWLESAYGEVDARSWSGAWASVGCRQERRALSELWEEKRSALPGSSALSGWCESSHGDALRRLEKALAPEFMEGGIGRGFDRQGRRRSAAKPRLRGGAMESPPRGGPRQVDGWRPAPIPLARPVEGRFESALTELVSGRHATFGLACTYVQRQGGKRLRPQLVAASAAAVGQACPEDLAACVEWIHMASLVLDDIMDEASTRRGGPALHVLTDAPFAASVAGWMLDSVRRRVTDSAAREVLVRAGIQLVCGQYREFRRVRSRSAYERCIEQKTAALFAAAAELGALEASDHQRSALSAFGRHIGMAFQMVDDLLDVLGGDLGKPVHTDVSAGRATLPWFVAHDLGTPSERARLADALSEGSDVSDLLTHSRVLAGVRGAIDHHRLRALEALDRVGLRTAELNTFAAMAVERSC